LFRNGVQGNGYPAIVGTGPNVNIWHYADNGRKMEAGDLVVMDYGGSLDYQVVDITRTWPVSGRFDDLQLRAYKCALETQKAIIAAMHPGAGDRPEGAVRDQVRQVPQVRRVRGARSALA
jgi:Xaa-Pro aminopeptidase